MKNSKNVEEKLPKIEVIPCLVNEVLKNHLKKSNKNPDSRKLSWDFENGDLIGPYPSFIKGKDYMMTGLREGLVVGYLLNREVS